MFCCAAADDSSAKTTEVIDNVPKGEPETPAAVPAPEPNDEEPPKVEPVEVKEVKEVKEQQPKGMVFVFDNEKEITFEKQPLGMSFKDVVPVVITKSAGHAAELGVQVGMTITKIGGQDTADKKYDEVINMIKAAKDALPTA